MIRLAVLDMAGTTVSDDGAVERAFLEAMSPDGAVSSGDAGAGALDYVRATMGQSKIVVFRALFDGDEEAAQAANQRFERAFDAAVGRGEVGPIIGAETALADPARPASRSVSPPASPSRRARASSTPWAGGA